MKLRLVEVRLLPVFMEDDGTHLTPIEHPPVVIPASEWSDYSSVRFPREVKEWEDKLNKKEK